MTSLDIALVSLIGVLIVTQASLVVWLGMRINQLSDRIADVQLGMVRLEERMTRLEERMDRLDQRFEAHERATAHRAHGQPA